MDDLFKKVINTGVGLLAQGNKRVQTALDKLVQESKLSEQEGQKIMADLRKSGEAKRKQFEKQVQDLAGNLRDRVGLSSEEPEATPTPKAKAAAPKAAAKKPSKAAGTVSNAPSRAQRPATAEAGAAKKAAAKGTGTEG